MLLLTGTGKVGSIAEVLGMLLIFFIILAATYFVTRYFGKWNAGMKNGGTIRIVETVKIAPEKYLQIVKVSGKYFLLGVGKTEISLIAELCEEDLVKKEDTDTKNGEGGADFKDILRKVLKK